MTMREWAIRLVFLIAGAGGGVGGAELVDTPADVEVVIATGVDAYVASDPAMVARAVAVYKDIAEDAGPADTVTLQELPAYMADRIDYTDERHGAQAQQFVLGLVDAATDVVKAGDYSGDASVDVGRLLRLVKDRLEVAAGAGVLTDSPIIVAEPEAREATRA